jgi:hypothetical protein
LPGNFSSGGKPVVVISFVQLILPMATFPKGIFGKLFEFLPGNLDFIN